MLWTIARVVIAVGFAVVVYLVGASLLRNFLTTPPPPDEPDLDRLEDVDYRYQCVVCGAQVVLYAAPEGEVPEPPRHCREPMVLVAPNR
jgi:hypothetical protein